MLKHSKRFYVNEKRKGVRKMAKIKSRWLDTTQKKIVFGGMVCFLLAGLIPPLMSYDHYSHSYSSSHHYGFMFMPDIFVGGIDQGDRIDFYRLIVEWIVVVVLTGGLLFLSKEKNPK
jgi:uncharacterized membrane protein